MICHTSVRYYKCAFLRVNWAEYYLIMPEEREMFKELDPILHSQLRLSIVSILMSVEEANFTFIKDETQATSGDIGIQIKKLQDAGYIKVKKSFKNNYPNTSLSITRRGIEAFENYVNNLKKYINPK